MMLIVMALVLPVFVLVPAGIYFYHFILRFFELIHLDVKKRPVKITALAVVLIVLIPSVNFFGIWAMCVLHFLAFCIIIEGIRFVVKKTGVRTGVAGSFLYRSGIIALAATILVISYGTYNMRHVIKKEYTVETEKKIPDGKVEIALITDLHMGTTMDGNKLRQQCERIEKQKPDLVILGGDIVDEGTPKRLMEQAAKELGKISSTYGTYYVYGNHDKALYSSHPPFRPEELSKALTENGIHVLEDQTVRAGGLTIVGRRDLSDNQGNRESMKKLLSGTPAASFRLVIDHQPQDFQENQAANVDLQLSGHTHGGQIWPLGLFTPFLRLGDVNYGSGKNQNFQYVVSSGIAGWGYPIRTGHHSEFVMIHVKEKKG